MKAYRDFLHLLLSHFLKEGASGLSGLAFLCSEPVMTDLLVDAVTLRLLLTLQVGENIQIPRDSVFS